MLREKKFDYKITSLFAFTAASVLIPSEVRLLSISLSPPLPFPPAPPPSSPARPLPPSCPSCDFRPHFRHPLQSVWRPQLGQALRGLRLRWLLRVFQTEYPKEQDVRLQIWKPGTLARLHRTAPLCCLPLLCLCPRTALCRTAQTLTSRVHSCHRFNSLGPFSLGKAGQKRCVCEVRWGAGCGG